MQKPAQRSFDVARAYFRILGQSYNRAHQPHDQQQRNRGVTSQAMIRPTTRQTTGMIFVGFALIVSIVSAATGAFRPEIESVQSQSGLLYRPPKAVVPALPEPAAEPTTPWQPLPGPEALTRRKQRIMETVKAWAAAWSQQDFETYVSAYADDFPPGGRSHEIWLALRWARVMHKASIHVQIVSPTVQMLSGQRARVSFVQIYQSPAYSDRINKELTLQQTEFGWRIVRETSSPAD